ncbi:OmpA family protein [Nissabacter sp. SGAir0207]|uniref:OmpA family protein n=1 Tax=Nissabacter sp. SGAir0207 TaxID=2126321 RepID=UPI0010CCEB3A|nr:OmpA family protein [Nissabacter sp. SGAir0207]QCR36004.1 hypothetical protein C1N62_07840 [Nissabacter sp. SGAir0207]
MSLAQKRLLALWAVLLSGLVCQGFLPVPRLAAILLMLAIWGLIGVVFAVTTRRHEADEEIQLAHLPNAAYRQPVVLVCGDMPYPWPAETAVLAASQGCWIRVAAHQDVEQVARQVLRLRPDWGRQLSVMVTVCPQQHDDIETLTSHLLSLRWKLGRLRRASGLAIPLVLQGVAGSAMMKQMIWQASLPNERLCVWDGVSPFGPADDWLEAGGAAALQHQVLMNALVDWFQQHVVATLTNSDPDMPGLQPAAVLWGMGPVMDALQLHSLWALWLQQHTALRQVIGWQPADNDLPHAPLLPDFILPLLPEGHGLTPRQRACRSGFTLFIVAAIFALCSSGWNNRQLVQRLSFDIQHYQRIPMNDHRPKAEAVNVLRQDLAQLDEWARGGEPLRLSLGLYQGTRLRMPILDVIRTYTPPAPPPKPAPKPPKIVRLDSMSLFDSGRAELKAGSTKMLVNSLVDIKAKPGWLIVVAGHTDNVGDERTNQQLSLRRAVSVRNWMRDTGDVPESCFAVQGYGESRPLQSNETSVGRAANRRVEISLVPQADACRLPATNLASPGTAEASTHLMEN